MFFISTPHWYSVGKNNDKAVYLALNNRTILSPSDLKTVYKKSFNPQPLRRRVVIPLLVNTIPKEIHKYCEIINATVAL